MCLKESLPRGKRGCVLKGVIVKRERFSPRHFERKKRERVLEGVIVKRSWKRVLKGFILKREKKHLHS